MAAQNHTGSDEPPKIFAGVLGRVLQDRRNELGIAAKDVADAIELSNSYWRAIEAGAILPPAHTACPLALVLKLDVSSTALLLSAAAYIADEAQEEKRHRRAQLVDAGVQLPPLGTLENKETLREEVAEFLIPQSDASRIGSNINVGSNIIKEKRLPWMFERSIESMIKELSEVPFNVDTSYFKKFVERERDDIAEVIAWLSYVPTGMEFFNADYDWGYLHNTHKPPFTIIVPDGTDLKATERDLRMGLERSKRSKSVKTPIGNRLSVKHGSAGFDFSNDTKRYIEKMTGDSTRYPNAWLYRLKKEGRTHDVGFLDDYAGGGYDYAGGGDAKALHGVALCGEDARLLIDKALQQL